jgi:sarcosine oxidase
MPDVIVVGLGSMGAAAAYYLAERGVRVLGIDRFTPPHGRGAHAGGSRIIRLAYAEGAAYVPLLRRAYELWSGVEAAGGVRLLTRTGGLMLGRPDSDLVAGALESARVYGLGHELLDAAEIRRRHPAFAPADDEVGVYEEVAGVVRPEAATDALLRMAAQAGADLRYGTAVTGWHPTATGVEVRTVDGPLAADRLVLCPGGWAPRLAADLGVPFRVERRVQHYWAPPGPEFGSDRCPAWIWVGSGATAYGAPALDPPPGDPLATGPAAGGPVVKAAFHTGDEPADAEAGAAPVSPGEQRHLRDWLSDRLPALAAGRWLGGKPCLCTLTPDGHFVVGRHPRHEAVTVAVGFSGHGFKFVPVIGEVLADLAERGATDHPVGPFAPGRFAGACR